MRYSEITKSRSDRDNIRSKLLEFYNTQYQQEEIWMFHPDIEIVIVSSLGRVKNLATGTIYKTYPNSDNYQMVNVRLESRNRRQSVMVHRLVAEAFFPYLGLNNYFYEVNHIDGNKNNNTISNLEWLTRHENLEHARSNNLVRGLRGEENPNSKLTDNDVRDIVELRKLGFSVISIARSYNMDRNTISSISRGKKRRLADVKYDF
jgi:hypothetical protein